MRITEQQLRALEMDEEDLGLYSHEWVSELKCMGPHVWVRKIQDPVTGRLSLVIVLDSDTRKDHINKALDAIMEERGRLVEKQGPDMIYFIDYLLQLYRNNQYCIFENQPDIPENIPLNPKLIYRNATPRELMWDINFDALVYCLRYSKQGGDQSKLGKSLFYGLLELMNFGDYSEIAKLYKDSKVELEDGYCPWDIDGFPVTKDKLENKLEKLVVKYGSKPWIPYRKLQMLRYYGCFLTWNDWHSAMALLEKTYPQSYERYKPRFDGRVSDIMKQQISGSQFKMQDWPEQQQIPPV